MDELVLNKNAQQVYSNTQKSKNLSLKPIFASINPSMRLIYWSIFKVFNHTVNLENSVDLG
jgi:hypothetical protein